MTTSEENVSVDDLTVLPVDIENIVRDYIAQIDTYEKRQRLNNEFYMRGLDAGVIFHRQLGVIYAHCSFLRPTKKRYADGEVLIFINFRGDLYYYWTARAHNAPWHRPVANIPEYTRAELNEDIVQLYYNPNWIEMWDSYSGISFWSYNQYEELIR